MRGRFVAYYRGSTDKQGKSGLGLDAQRQAMRDYLDGGNWTLLDEFVEVESGNRFGLGLAERPPPPRAFRRWRRTASPYDGRREVSG